MKTILLATESRVTLELIRVYLEAKDVRVLDAQGGEEVLALTRVERPDLLLCDLRLPELDGLGLCRELAHDPRLRRTPVVLLATDVDAETLRSCREAGARDVLRKPVGARELHVAVWRHAGIVIGQPLPARSRLDRAS
jgi:CheY-like chemotaxis protein